MIGIPVVLSSAFSFAANAAGAMGTPDDPSALRSPKNSLLVDAIQLWATADGQNGDDPPIWHEWDVKLGRAQLTSGMVPPAVCVRDEAVADNSPTEKPKVSSPKAYLWTFPRPLFVPAGAVLQVKLRAGCASCLAQVSFYGRQLPAGYPVPQVLPVPYAAMFRPPVADVSATQTDPQVYIYRSGKDDLHNPFDVPFHVCRFITASIPSSSLGMPGANVLGPIYAPSMRLADAAGHPIVRESIRFQQFGSSQRAELPAQFDLAPRTALYATLDMTHTAAQTGWSYDFQAALGMIGWRDVQLSEVM